MIRFFTASFDASVYLQQPDQNAGRDEVLEIGKLYYGDSKEVCRTLIKFPISQIVSTLNEVNLNVTASNWKAYLNLKSVILPGNISKYSDLSEYFNFANP